MTRTPAALAILFVLSASRTVRAEPCAPRAALAGDREAVEAVGAELVKLGVALAAGSARCPAVQATVELAREGGINVAVRGSAQRSEGRVLSDPEVAAMWIDAWVRDDLDVAGWAPEPAAAPLAAPSVVAPHDAVPATAVNHFVLDELGIAALYEQAWTDDNTSWHGGNVAACVRVAGLCIGGRVRALVQPDQIANLTAAARSDVSAFATASMPIAAGQTIFAPEVGLGVGRFATRRVEGCAPAVPPPNCDPTDPMCVMDPVTGCTDASGTSPGGKLYVGDNFETATYTPRITLALRISVPLFHHVWLDGLASYALMPLGHGQPFEPEKPLPMTTAGQVALPGEPGAGWIVGVGLRLGAP